MADQKASQVDEEKSLYLMQTLYLEEQIERFQLKCQDLDRQNKDLSSQYKAQEEDMKTSAERLKCFLAGNQQKVDGLLEKLEKQQQSAKEDREALDTEHQRQKQEMIQLIDSLASKKRMQDVRLGELGEQCVQMKQRLSMMESVEKQLHNQEKDDKAANYRVKMKAMPERERITENVSSTSTIEQKRPCLKLLQFLQEEGVHLKEELHVLHGRDMDSSSKWKMLQEDIKKCSHEKSDFSTEVKQLAKELQQLKVDKDSCCIVRKDSEAKAEVYRERMASTSEACDQQRTKLCQHQAELEKVRSRRKELESVMQEAATILKHILMDSDQDDCQWKTRRLLEIVDSTSPAIDLHH